MSCWRETTLLWREQLSTRASPTIDYFTGRTIYSDRRLSTRRPRTVRIASAGCRDLPTRAAADRAIGYAAVRSSWKTQTQCLTCHSAVNKLIPDQQSVYWAFRSTQTAIAGPLLSALDTLALLDLSAAFDTILLQRLRTSLVWKSMSCCGSVRI